MLLLPSVGEQVLLQIWSYTEWLVALCTIVVLLSTVGCDVFSQTASSTGWIIALCAAVLFLPGMGDQMPVKMSSSTEWLVASCTNVTRFSTVGFDTGSQITILIGWIVTLCFSSLFEPSLTTTLLLFSTLLLFICTCMELSIGIRHILTFSSNQENSTDGRVLIKPKDRGNVK